MNARRTIHVALALGLAAGLLASPIPAAAQQTQGSLTSDYLLTGYGTLDYRMTPDRSVPDDELRHDFGASVSPIMLFMLGDDLLFQSELEFGLEGSTTSTTLEYAQLTYQGFDNVQLTAGKFLLPFGLFSERLHPSWINKLPSMPLLYGHAHGGTAEGSLLPVLSDIGVKAQFSQPLGDRWTLDVTGWVSQGPRAAATEGENGGDDHAHRVEPVVPTPVAASPGEIPGPGLAPGHDDEAAASVAGLSPVAFGTNTSDNNDNKMIGARIGMVRGGDFEVYLSGFHAMYDPGDFLDYYGTNLAVEWRPGPYEIRGEGILQWQEFTGETEFETLESPGYYLQASRRFGSLEPVLRWSHLPDATVDGAAVRHEVRQLALGLEYWLAPSVPLKAAYEINLDGDERVLFQWAYGF